MHSSWSASTLLLLLLQLCIAAVTLLPCSVNAATFNVVNATTPPQLEGLQVEQNPYDIQPGCNSLGVCVPFNFTLPNRTLWYWCGWSTKQRTDYYVNGPSTVTVQMMRWSSLNGCGLANLSKMTSCEALYNSVCTNNTCYQRVLGLAFVDEACLVIGNNNVNKSAKVSVQMFQYYDEPRYYGTVFTVIYTILILGGVTAYISWTCYKEITSPPDRLVELRSFEAQLKSDEDSNPAVKVEPDRDASDPGSFQGRVRTALHKAKNLVLRNKGASQA